MREKQDGTPGWYTRAKRVDEAAASCSTRDRSEPCGRTSPGARATNQGTVRLRNGEKTLSFQGRRYALVHPAGTPGRKTKKGLNGLPFNPLNSLVLY